MLIDELARGASRSVRVHKQNVVFLKVTRVKGTRPADSSLFRPRVAPAPTGPRRRFGISQAVLRFLGLLLLFMVSRAGLAQTPSPLQEWQYSGGIVLARLFEP